MASGENASSPLPQRQLRSCSFCQRTFTKIEHLQRHRRSHTGEKPYTCKLCKKSFSRSDVLRRHYRLQHGLEKVKTERISSKHARDSSSIDQSTVADHTQWDSNGLSRSAESNEPTERNKTSISGDSSSRGSTMSMPEMSVSIDAASDLAFRGSDKGDTNTSREEFYAGHHTTTMMPAPLASAFPESEPCTDGYDIQAQFRLTPGVFGPFEGDMQNQYIAPFSFGMFPGQAQRHNNGLVNSIPSAIWSASASNYGDNDDGGAVEDAITTGTSTTDDPPVPEILQERGAALFGLPQMQTQMQMQTPLSPTSGNLVSIVDDFSLSDSETWQHVEDQAVRAIPECRALSEMLDQVQSLFSLNMMTGYDPRDPCFCSWERQ